MFIYWQAPSDADYDIAALANMARVEYDVEHVGIFSLDSDMPFLVRNLGTIFIRRLKFDKDGKVVRLQTTTAGNMLAQTGECFLPFPFIALHGQYCS